MKLCDILSESDYNSDSFNTDYTDGMKNDIYDLLVASKANGLTSIDTPKFLSQLQNMGYEMEEPALLDMLQDHPMVQDANNSEITLTGEIADADGSKQDAEKNRDIVRNLAQKATKRDLK